MRRRRTTALIGAGTALMVVGLGDVVLARMWSAALFGGTTNVNFALTCLAAGLVVMTVAMFQWRRPVTD